MPPGPAELRVWIHPLRRPVLHLVDIAVKAGTDTDDPRVLTIDLRGKYRRITLTFRDDKGSSVPSGRIVWGAKPDQSPEFHGGSLTRVIPAKGIPGPIRVFARSHVPLVLPGIYNNGVVVLRRQVGAGQ